MRARPSSRSPTEHRSPRTRPSKSAHMRIGLVGPNGVGKSTVLRLLAGEEARPWIRRHRSAKDDGRPSAAGGRRTCGETLRERLARLTGVSTAERALEHARRRWPAARETTLCESPQALSDRYDAALSRFLALGGGDLDARAAATCAPSGCASTSTGRSRASRAAKPRACRSPRCCSPARTSCCSTSRRTTSTSRGSRSSRRSSRASRCDRARLARPGVPRPDGATHRRDRSALARDRRVGRRLVGLRAAP